MNPVDIAVADYIVSLWGRKRRAFARAYWFHIARGMPRPSYQSCFGAAYIADKLELLARTEQWWEPVHQPEKR